MRLVRRETRLGVQVMGGLASIYLLQGRTEDARTLADELSWVAQATGDTRNIAQANYIVGMVFLGETRYEQAQRVFQTARALAATCGDYRMQLNCLNNLGEVSRFRGEDEQARGLYNQFVRLARMRSFSEMEAVGSLNLALMSLVDREFRQADRHAMEAAQALASMRRHWAWLYIAAIRAACAARGANYQAARQWWSLARERGVDQVRSDDLRTPLDVLVDAAGTLGWRDLAGDAKRVRDRI